jgi:hypothetical protein
MSKRPAKLPADPAPALTIPERVLLFCVAIDRHHGHDGDGHDRGLRLTKEERAVIAALLAKGG